MFEVAPGVGRGAWPRRLALLPVDTCICSWPIRDIN